MTESVTSDSRSDLDQDYTAGLLLQSDPGALYAALTTLEGLAAWWTPVTGHGLAGGELRFTFGPEAWAVMRVEAADAVAGVRWTNTDCHLEDWVGTTVHFEWEPLADGGTALRFRHSGLTPRLECYSDCKSGWDHFLPSLQAYVDTGQGNPWMSPADVARRQARAGRGEPTASR